MHISLTSLGGQLLKKELSGKHKCVFVCARVRALIILVINALNGNLHQSVGIRVSNRVNKIFQCLGAKAREGLMVEAWEETCSTHPGMVWMDLGSTTHI